LWRGLRTPPRSATEGLRSCTACETFGPSQWPGPETGPQRGGPETGPQRGRGTDITFLTVYSDASQKRR